MVPRGGSDSDSLPGPFTFISLIRARQHISGLTHSRALFSTIYNSSPGLLKADREEVVSRDVICGMEIDEKDLFHDTRGA